MMPQSILFVVHDFLPDVIAGTEMYTARVAETLGASHPVAILYTLRRPSLPQYSCLRSSFNGVPTIGVVQNYAYRPLEDVLCDQGLEHIFRQILNEFEPTIVHFQHLEAWPLSLPGLAAAFGARVFFTLHDFQLICPSGGQLILEPERTPCPGPEPKRCTACYSSYAARYGRLEALAFRLSGMLPPALAGLPFRMYHTMPHRLKASIKYFNGLMPKGTGSSKGGTTTSAVQTRLRGVEALERDVTVFISPSKSLLHRFQSLGFLLHSETRVIPNPGLPRNRPFTPLPPSPPLRLIYIGTLAPHKGIDRLLDAVRCFLPTEVHLTLYGRMDSFPEYVSNLQARNLPHVRWAGHVEPHLILDVLSKAHVLVLGSRWPENAPLTILEAFSAGRVVVAPRVGGIPEMARDGVDALLYDGDGVEGLTAAIHSLIVSPELLERLTGQVRAPLSLEAHVSMLEELYSRGTRT